MSDTPKTDAKERETEHSPIGTHAHYGWKMARKMERELSAVAAERDALRKAIEMHNLQMDNDCEPRGNYGLSGKKCREFWADIGRGMCVDCPRDYVIEPPPAPSDGGKT